MMTHQAEQQDVLKMLLDSRDEVVDPESEDLNQIIYRDPNSIHAEEHRSFRLSDAVPIAPLSEIKKMLRGEEDIDEEHRSFKLTSITKKKSTVYFSRKLHRRLKNAKYRIDKMLPQNLRAQVSMSRIINIALLIVLYEFDKKGDNSLLLKQIIKDAQR